MTAVRDVLEQLGIETQGEKQLRGRCPVHMMVVGHEDQHPSWYANALNGANICFSCGWRGSFRSLLRMLDVDEEILDTVRLEVMANTVRNWHKDATVSSDDAEKVYISEYALLTKNPLPPKKAMEFRQITAEACNQHGVRWDKAKRKWLLPVYHTDGHLLGWQEKSVGYFNNVPEGMEKRHSLFGYDCFLKGTGILVESPLDVVRLTSEGIAGGLATFGSYVSNEQLEAVVRICDSVVLAFDNDPAGRVARDYCSTALHKLGMLDVKYFVYPPEGGKDPGELSRQELLDGIKYASMFRRIKSWQ